MNNIPASLLASFQRLIRERCGLICEGVASEKLAGAILQRHAATVTSALSDYFNLLSRQAEEFDALVSLLTNNETYFFREANQLECLVETWIPELLALRSDGTPLCILSAGCSTGEEPYSIAIALFEQFGDSTGRLFTIIGVDIDPVALSKARQARYGTYSFRALPEVLRARYFSPVGGMQYALSDEIRALVQFKPMNLLLDPPSSAMPALDVVFFRNVSIYFDEATRCSIQKNLHVLMKENGRLMVGNTETLANDLGVFNLEQAGDIFYFSKGGQASIDKILTTDQHAPQRLLPVKMNASGKAVDRGSPLPAGVRDERSIVKINPVSSQGRVQQDLSGIRALIADQLWLEALTALQAHVPSGQASCEQELALLESWVRLQIRDVETAEQMAHAVHQHNEWSLDASVLLGLAARQQSQNHTALNWFKRAAYINRECWVAHYYLGELYRSEMNHDPARRSYKQVLQVLAGSHHIDGGLLIPLGLPLTQIRFLCERHITSLIAIAQTE
jgi:chemotaxis protein methyltransferase CheR